MISSVIAGLVFLEPRLSADLQLIDAVTNKIIIGEFIANVLPILWIGIGSIFGGILLSNWLSGSLKKISDILRLVVLVAIYPTVAQFTNVLINDESAFSLVPPLLAGLVITLISATLLFRKYRKHKGGEILTE
jgi:putative membrane protein